MASKGNRVTTGLVTAEAFARPASNFRRINIMTDKTNEIPGLAIHYDRCEPVARGSQGRRKIIADTSDALTLREASYAPVQYIPGEMSIWRADAQRTYDVLPYKGDASTTAFRGGDRSLNACGPTRPHLRRWRRSRTTSLLPGPVDEISERVESAQPIGLRPKSMVSPRSARPAGCALAANFPILSTDLPIQSRPKIFLFFCSPNQF